MIRTTAIYAAAAFFEIAGCFGVWLWLRDSKPGWLVLPAMVSLLIFAWLLTLVPSNAAGRAYAAYGGFYIVASLVWLWSIEGLRPDQWDILGAALCLIGALIIVFGPRYAAP